MRDYAGNYHMKDRSAARRPGWRTVSRTKGNNPLFCKTLGVIFFLVAVIGVVASYWVGHRIQESLTGITHAQELQIEKKQTQTILLNEQVRLLQVKRLQAYAAVQVGLYSPGERQQIAFR